MRCSPWTTLRKCASSARFSASQLEKGYLYAYDDHGLLCSKTRHSYRCLRMSRCPLIDNGLRKLTAFPVASEDHQIFDPMEPFDSR